jgi:hypothetical protein
MRDRNADVTFQLFQLFIVSGTNVLEDALEHVVCEGRDWRGLGVLCAGEADEQHCLAGDVLRFLRPLADTLA